MKKVLCVLLMFFVMFGFAGCNSNNNNPLTQEQQSNQDNGENEVVTNMNLKIGDKTFIVKLENNKTVTALVNNLPLTLNMSELNGNEKYYWLPNNLPTNASKVSYINAGDVMLYQNNCLVIFYDSFKSGYSYTKIGHIENTSNLASTLGSGSVEVIWSV